MRSTKITFSWAEGGEYSFDLPLKEVEQLESDTGFGVQMLLYRIQQGQHFSKEPRLTILYGLLGAGMATVKARSLVKQWVDDRPGKERDLPAQTILMAWMLGAPEGKKADELKTEIEGMAPADSTSAQSTEPVQL
jgi:hypothetical protein